MNSSQIKALQAWAWTFLFTKISWREVLDELLYDSEWMESSSNVSLSLSQQRFGSDGEGSRIHPELCHLVGRENEALRGMEEEDSSITNVVTGMENGSA